MTRGVAVDVHGYGQAGDVGGAEFHVHLEGRHAAAESGGAGAELVDEFQQLVFESGVAGIGVAAFNVARAGLFGAQAGQFHVAAYAYADDHGRAGAGSGVAHGFHHGLLHAFYAVGGNQHVQRALVFAARALGGQAQGDAVAGHEARVDDGGRVVAGVFAFKERFRHRRLAQVALGVALGNALIDGVFKKTAGDVDVLTYFGEHHGEAGILTDGDTFLGGDARVLDELIQHVAAGGGKFAFSGLAHGRQRGFGQAAAGLHGQPRHGVAYEFDGNFSHGDS